VTNSGGLSVPAVPSTVVQLGAGALPADAPTVLAGPTGEALARAAGYAGQALSENTRRAFGAWYEAGGVSSLPTAPVVIAGHLACRRPRCDPGRERLGLATAPTVVPAFNSPRASAIEP
jgi:hypothetical protein